ncbi:hypothetical protein [Synechococcus phage DSL-LC02]|nr:hypothetical protein [Synechococcus phage DSL-LC02]
MEITRMMPDSETLNKMWNVAECDSVETDTPVHQIFAKLLYNKITKEVKNESH